MKLNNNICKNGYWFIPFCLLAFVGSVFFSCGPMDETYKDFIKDGEIIYTGKVDSLKAFPGRDRMKLTWLLVSDPKITKNVVYWNSKADSLVLNVVKTGNVDTISAIINDLPEKLYTFEVYSYDNVGHSSVVSNVISTVYGNNYAATLNNRPLKSVVYKPDTATVNWFGVSSQVVIVNIKFTDAAGVLRTFNDYPVLNPQKPGKPAVFLATTKLPHAKQGTTLTFRSGYKPLATCIDTFFTAWSAPVKIP